MYSIAVPVVPNCGNGPMGDVGHSDVTQSQWMPFLRARGNGAIPRCHLVCALSDCTRAPDAAARSAATGFFRLLTWMVTSLNT